MDEAAEIDLFDDGNGERSLALEIMDGRKCQNTKNQYRLKVEQFKKSLQSKLLE